MTPRALGATRYIALTALVNAALYHWPLFAFAAGSLTLGSLNGILTLVTLVIALFVVTALLLGLLALVSHRILKPFAMLMALGSSVAVYFVVTYHVVLDKTMMGNVHNTNVAESAELFHPTLLAYVLVLGVLPCWLLSRLRVEKAPRLRLAALMAALLVGTLLWAWLVSSTWGWIDKNSKKLGGMVMPWSYLINMARYEVPRLLASDKQVPLPDAVSSSSEKTVVVLVVGEAARAQDFEFYGYARPTNPLLKQAGAIALKDATACSTYTTASLRCILSHVDSSSEFSTRYEPLPSYLQRSGVDVVWRSHNWGEPPLKVQTYEKAADLAPGCTGQGCDYDEVLLTGLEARIRSSSSPKVFVVLHTSGSHGPAYSTKYPPQFEQFKPVCASVELGQCSHEELVNAYDNTILYTDYFVSQAIGVLRKLEGTSSLLIYLSDHGESLGEYGLYLHGTPWSIAPDFQKKIPFVVWMSDAFRRQRGVQAPALEAQATHSQRDVFHTVMGAFALHSDAYIGEFDVFNPAFSENP